MIPGESSRSKRAKIFDVGGENDASLLATPARRLRIGKAVQMQVIPNVFHIKMRVK